MAKIDEFSNKLKIKLEEIEGIYDSTSLTCEQGVNTFKANVGISDITGEPVIKLAKGNDGFKKEFCINREQAEKLHKWLSKLLKNETYLQKERP